MKEEKKDEKKGAGKVGMGAFNVAKMANEGVVAYLTLPDGTKTEDFLRIRGSDSKAFQIAVSKAQREKVQLLKLNKSTPEKEALMRQEIDREMIASLVAGWSFDEECTKARVVSWFEDAPQMVSFVDNFAADRSNFFKKPPQA